ncbi:hypothetical protein ECHLIB_0173 [Ehrlichia chaffeensis str. Liberty]|uniref:hypothetical protein n=1 Tax=Ehrlichia chaffeensis TaxID=945 RepID=UPI000444EA99|nr:hypothetical protein [Ehrlichia chaffeensis]AHX06252.1 hypothetical protein ECHLIB_0173 [Ehrlichia chaffeensis str. Liberty]
MKASIILLSMIVLCTMFGIRCQASQRDCLGLVYALHHCTSYTCEMDFFNNKVQYTIFGLRNNSCKLVEKDDSGLTLCYVPKEKLKVMSEYLVRVITSNLNINTSKIEDVLFDVCNFYSVIQESLIPENEEVTEQNVQEIKRAAELKRRNFNISKIKSIFFSDEDIMKLHTIYAQSRSMQ